MNILAENKFHKVALALGSNDLQAGMIFVQACNLLNQKGFTVTGQARIIRTAPVDCPVGTPDFFNSALIGSFAGTPEELLKITQSIEVALGRPAKHGFHEARTLDIDIIIFDRIVLDTPELVIPHPAAQERDFVLQPLAEIAPDWIFCNNSVTVAEALENLQRKN